jgi:hypothetical protein
LFCFPFHIFQLSIISSIIIMIMFSFQYDMDSSQSWSSHPHITSQQITSNHIRLHLVWEYAINNHESIHQIIWLWWMGIIGLQRMIQRDWLCDIDQDGAYCITWNFDSDLQHSFVQEAVNMLICWGIESLSYGVIESFVHSFGRSWRCVFVHSLVHKIMQYTWLGNDQDQMKCESWNLKDAKRNVKCEQRTMKDERWTMKDGRWTMENQKWKMKDENEQDKV